MTAEEIVGRKQIELENLHIEYDRLLGVLGSVIEGVLNPKLVSVDLTARVWKIEPLPE